MNGCISLQYSQFSVNNILLDSGSVIHASIAVGDEPIDIAFGGDVFGVVNFSDGNVDLLDTNDVLFSDIEVGSSPVAINFGLDAFAVANFEDGTVDLISTTGDTIQSDLGVGAKPIAICFSSSGSNSSDRFVSGIEDFPFNVGLENFPTFTSGSTSLAGITHGDVNGDGFKDLVIAATSSTTKFFVLFGTSSPITSTDLDTLDGSNGFKATSSLTGGTNIACGDINGDAIDDVLITADNVAIVVYGKREEFSSSIDLTALDGSDGFTITSSEQLNSIGFGDVNGDGFNDIFVGARFADFSTGETYVLFGKSSNFSSSVNIDTLINGTDAFKLVGEKDNDFSASHLDAGDINGDGFDDILIGSTQPSISRDKATRGGLIHVFFGQSSSFNASYNLIDLDGTDGFQFSGKDNRDSLHLATTGDVNCDGFADIIMGTTRGEPSGGNDEGECYIFFGKANSFTAEFDLETLDGSNGFEVIGGGTRERLGALAGVGDIDQDGFDDFIVGNGSLVFLEELAYTFFGKSSGFAASSTVDDLSEGDGFIVERETSSRGGVNQGIIFDFNGDGFPDLAVRDAPNKVIHIITTELQ